MTLPITAVWPGSPYPRGATWDGEGVNFSLFSAHAERVELCIFDPSGRHEVQRVALREQTDEIWHCYLPEARPGLLYGYRVHGPYRPHKLLVEPYAKHLSGTLRWSERTSATASATATRTCRWTAATTRRACPSAA
jgi:glycogen operon protein